MRPYSHSRSPINMNITNLIVSNQIVVSYYLTLEKQTLCNVIPFSHVHTHEDIVAHHH
jgi:hypothetical protein